MVKHTNLIEPHSTRKTSVFLGIPTVLEAPSRTSTEKNPDEIQEIQNEISLRILETKEEELHQPLPRWMRNYRVVCYCTYFVIACFSIFYLWQIGIYQSNPYMHIQYSDIVSYLELNSYSLLSPLLCPIFMVMLAYHLKKNVNLEEGDFFGLLGFLLFFALINFHDGYGVWKLANDVTDDNHRTPTLDPPPMDSASTNDLHWQYAWSTSRKCAKKYVRDLIYQKEELHVQREIVIEFGPAQERQLVEHATSMTKKEECLGYHATKEKAKLRKWMVDLQMNERCCGPYGEMEWQTRFATDEATGCHEGWEHEHKEDQLYEQIKGCYDPLMKWLKEVCGTTCWIMITQGVLYIVSGVLAVIHHTAMKLEAEVMVKQYSLLDMRDPKPKEDPWWRQERPADKPVISGAYDGKKLKLDADARKSREGFEGVAKIKMKLVKHKKLKAVGKKLVNINSTISVASLTTPSKGHGHHEKEKKKPELSESQVSKLKHLQHH